MFPIIGGRKVEHLLANIEGLGLILSNEHIAAIESALPFDKGFPMSMIVRDYFVLKMMRCDSVLTSTFVLQGEYGTYPYLLEMFTTFEKQPLLQSIEPKPLTN